MSQEIPERWRLLYSAVTSGDLDGMMEFFHEDVDDHVVVGEAFKGRGKDSGVEVTMQSGSASLLRDDRIVRRDEFLDRAEALEAAGLAPD
jgi:ketosteroid isomerase-like protein